MKSRNFFESRYTLESFPLYLGSLSSSWELEMSLSFTSGVLEFSLKSLGITFLVILVYYSEY